MSDEKPFKSPGARTVIANNRSIAVGGDASNNVIVTGDNNTVAQQGVDLPKFLAALSDLKRHVRESALPLETVELVEAELVDVEKHAEKPKPSRALLEGKLGTVMGLLKDAAEVGTALIPAARQLGAWAGQLF